MAKYLRYLAVHPEPAVLAVLPNSTNHLCWMYEYYATPLPTGGVAKVNVWLTANAEPPAAPAECLGIADVRQYFDVPRFLRQLSKWLLGPSLRKLTYSRSEGLDSTVGQEPMSDAGQEERRNQAARQPQ